MSHEHPSSPAPFWRTRFAIGFVVLAAVAAWLLFEEHRAHMLGAIPYLLLLACPLMHGFMHHGHHRSQSADGTDRPISNKGDAR